MLFVKKLTKTAKLPIRQHPGDAGYDLASDEGVLIKPHDWRLISTGISIAIPKGTYGRIAPRSGFSYKKGTMIGAGVCDEAYRGEIKVLVFNLSEKFIEIQRGDRIAQLILEKIATPDVIEVEDLNQTKRGGDGFGSTGI